MIANCTSTQMCSECKGRHHILLHQNHNQTQNQGQNQMQSQNSQRNRSDTAQGSNAQSTQSSQGAAQKSSQPAPANSAKSGQKTASINLARYLSNSVGDDNISLRTIPVFVCSEDGHETLVTALLDDGAQSSIVTRSLADRLGLTGTPINARIEGVGGQVTKYSTIVTNVYVAPSFTADLQGAQSLHKVEVIVMDNPITHGSAIDWRKAARMSLTFVGLSFPRCAILK